MMVRGIRTKPAEARAMAPVVRLARFESWGKEDDEYFALGKVVDTIPVELRRFERATRCRRALSVEKYKAEPKPVRMTEGSVPRHRWRSGVGPEVISFKVDRSVDEGDC